MTIYVKIEGMNRCAIYCRVSTADQSTQLQQRELEAFAKARGWTVAAVYTDKSTGTHSNRLQLQGMIKAVRSRQVDIVLCWKLDRFFRSLKDLVVTLQEMTDLGVSFVSLKDQIDLTTPQGRLMVHLLAAFAEFEASLIRSRVKAGLENARKNGTQLGRPPQVDPNKVFQLRAEGLSMSVIAKRLGCSKSAVHKTLQKFRSQNCS